MGIVPHITTERLLLREARRADFEAYASIVMDPARPAALPPVDWRMAWRMFNAGLGQWLMDGIGHWAIEDRATGVFIGSVGAFHREPPPGPCDPADLELGWSMVRGHRGRGLATEAARAVVAHAFDTRRAPRVVAHIDHDNPASIRVAEKLGMRYEREVAFYDERLRRYELPAKSSS